MIGAAFDAGEASYATCITEKATTEAIPAVCTHCSPALDCSENTQQSHIVPQRCHQLLERLRADLGLCEPGRD